MHATRPAASALAPPPVTTGAALELAARTLADAGLADPSREAAELYAALVCGAASRAWLDRDRPIAPGPAASLAAAAARRASGWPQAYAAGRANFRGHWLRVDQRVLIPRPETETLVDRVVDWLRRRLGSVPRSRGAPVAPVVADIGTGSGAIAIALALEAPVAGVIATDTSAGALSLAMENAASLGAAERVSFRRGDLLAPLLGEPVDAIVSNPPYVATAEWEALEPQVRDFEPRLALDAGPDGLDHTRRLVAAAGRLLVPGGLLALEADARRAGRTAALLSAAGFVSVEVGEDLFGRPRTVIGRLPEAP